MCDKFAVLLKILLTLVGLQVLVNAFLIPCLVMFWVEEEKVAGNLTLIPFRVRREWYYFIANVATHPDYRRRGIARKLTECALQHAQNHGASAAWLQVRDDNEAAYQLYLSFNMVERARRSSWQSKANQLVFPEPLPEGLTIGKTQTLRLAASTGMAASYLPARGRLESQLPSRTFWPQLVAFPHPLSP
jgi:N-acetylglutamate synthase-like GNAT family acetyltransferase